MFKKAERKRAKLRLALMGPSGSGKTYSALQLAKGMRGKIAMIDTERGSGELYSSLCDYDTLQLAPPFDPKNYIEAIKAAEDAGYEILIIDSLSHAWSGEGGILDIHDKVSKSVRNSFAAWREVTPAHNALVDAILASPCHIIVTLRTKTAYEVQNDNGKAKVAKVGLAPVQRDGIEYEFTVVLDLSIDGHVATSTKDRTGLFDGRYFTPSIGTGMSLANWLDSTGPTSAIESAEPVDEDVDGLAHLVTPNHRNRFMIEQIDMLMAQLKLGVLAEEYATYVCGRYGVGSFEELSPQQLTEQAMLLRQCKKNEEKHLQFIDILRQQKLAA